MSNGNNYNMKMIDKISNSDDRPDIIQKLNIEKEKIENQNEGQAKQIDMKDIICLKANINKCIIQETKDFFKIPESVIQKIP